MEAEAVEAPADTANDLWEVYDMKKDRVFISINVKITILVITFLIAISLFISYFAYNKSALFLRDLTYEHVSFHLDIAEKLLKDKISAIERDILLLIDNFSLFDLSYNLKLLFENTEDRDQFFKDLRRALLSGKEPKNSNISSYLLSFKRLLNFTDKYINTRGYENLVLIDVDSGYIYFESKLKDDFGTSLYKDFYRHSSLAEVFHHTRKLKEGEIYFSDFSSSLLYGKEPIAYFAVPIYKNGRPKDVCAIVVPLSTLNKVFKGVVSDNPDFYIYTVGEDNKVRIETDETQKIGVPIPKDIDVKKKILEERVINGAKYLFAYMPVKIFNKRWIIVGEVPESTIILKANSLKRSIFYILIILTILGSLLIYFHISWIIGSIKRLTQTVDDILNKKISGDINIEIKTGDEIEILSHSFNKLLHSERERAETIKKLISILDKEIKNLEIIANKEQDVSAMQASSITELAAAIEQFSKTMESISKVNEQALREVASLKENAMKNRDVQERVRTGMEDLKKEIENVFSSFSEVARMNEGIKGIADIIDNVAEQIKLIAFNASLEAARAGDAGRGFSVIAVQIRELLENITKQNIEIKNLINKNSKNITKISQSTEKMLYFLETEEANIEEINQFIEKVLTLIEKNEEFISSISISQKQQKISIDNFIISIKESKEKIKEGEELATRIAASIAELKKLMSELSELKDAGVL